MSFLDGIRTSSPSRQVAAGVAAAVVLTAVLVAAYFYWFHKPYATLVAGVRPAEAAAVVAQLEKEKVSYRLADQGATVLVPAADVDKARLDIATGDLPIKGLVGFELFDKSDMGLTEFAQRINYQRALQGELARTIMAMDAVDAARVHLMLAEPTIFRDDRRPSKAAVTVSTRGGKPLGADTVQGIQRLVAAAVPDLAAGDVVVLDGAGNVLTGYQQSPSQSSPQAQQQQAIEQYYTARIRQAVAQVTSADITVDVIAHIDPSAIGAGAAAPSMDLWAPSVRTFPLTVAISFATTVSPDTESQALRAARQAAGVDESKGDSLTLGNAVGVGNDARPAEPIVSPVSPAESARPTASGRWSIGPSALWLTASIPLLIILSAAAVLLHRRGREPRRLSERERREMAERLRQLLDQEDAHAASF
jgi:flagellar M-ring protein FliF